MSTDVLRRNVARELDRLHEHQRRGLTPVMCVYARVEGEPPDNSYRPRFSPLPYLAAAPVETVLTDAVFHPSIGLTRPPIVNTQWSVGGTHVTAYSGYPQSGNSFQMLSLFGQPPVHPIDSETPVSEAIAAAQTVSERLQLLIRSLSEPLVERLGFKSAHRPSDWIEVLFHLGWHFPDHGIEAGRFRILSRSAEVPWDARCPEQELQLGGVRVTPDVFPGVIISRLGEGSDFLTASINALQLILEAVDGIALGARPQPSAEFGRLHGTFSQLAEAHAVLPEN